MKLIDNLNNTLGSDIGENLSSKSRLKIAASYFSIYAYKVELNKHIHALESDLNKLVN